MPLLIAVTEAAYTPEELVEMLHDTYEMAVENNDWKGMFQVIQLVLNYGIGKPVQRTLKATIDPDEIRAFFQRSTGGDEGDNSDDDIVDVTTNEV